MPHFPPVRVRGGRHRLHRLVRHRRRAVAAGLAVTAAALVAAGPSPGTGAQDGGRARGHPVSDGARERPAARRVAAPVRIADAATVRLLTPGDRVDVVASEEGAGGGVSVIARAARVVQVPEPDAGARGDAVPEAGVSEAGALVVLSVPPATAHRLVGASARARLAVTLC
ncbi:RcpC/CpaB family pilus assembly protein [Streptomyces sp. NPDC032940]|uniref:RcpC/CpaB family pilus assembly protein n=1 Tax=Streptomyces sp. NPDC032940 TaxID=3155366 RepID=UPI0033E21A87